MEALEAILTRRSVRSFSSEPVSMDLARQVIQAGMYAPSASDEQPWYFLVLTERDVLAKIPAIHPYAEAAAQAPMSILLCGDPGSERQPGMWAQDCAAATENMLIAATALGLGSLWVGFYPREDRMQPLRRLLDLPNRIMPFALIPLGYPAQQPEQVDPRERFKEERIRLNHW